MIVSIVSPTNKNKGRALRLCADREKISRGGEGSRSKILTTFVLSHQLYYKT